MTRQRFITKWLGNEATKYTEEFRDLMRDDLDKVIDYHHKVNELNKSDVIKSVCECGNELTEKEVFYETCLKCERTLRFWRCLT